MAHATLNRFHSRLPRELGVERVAEADLAAAAALMRSCLAEALRSVRLPDSPAGLEAVRALERDLEEYCGWSRRWTCRWRRATSRCGSAPPVWPLA